MYSAVVKEEAICTLGGVSQLRWEGGQRHATILDTKQSNSVGTSALELSVVPVTVTIGSNVKFTLAQCCL